MLRAAFAMTFPALQVDGLLDVMRAGVGTQFVQIIVGIDFALDEEMMMRVDNATGGLDGVFPYFGEPVFANDDGHDAVLPWWRWHGGRRGCRA
jgi:hypothetical protein